MTLAIDPSHAHRSDDLPGHDRTGHDAAKNGRASGEHPAAAQSAGMDTLAVRGGEPTRHGYAAV
ncbi:MAG TPA: hypothetical protein VMG12_27550, partial [Polyangiaceae bacterium]|nr:hypothetical protein [Polyangiaceae bacterium]